MPIQLGSEPVNLGEIERRCCRAEKVAQQHFVIFHTKARNCRLDPAFVYRSGQVHSIRENKCLPLLQRIVTERKRWSFQPSHSGIKVIATEGVLQQLEIIHDHRLVLFHRDEHESKHPLFKRERMMLRTLMKEIRNSEHGPFHLMVNLPEHSALAAPGL